MTKTHVNIVSVNSVNSIKDNRDRIREKGGTKTLESQASSELSASSVALRRKSLGNLSRLCGLGYKDLGKGGLGSHR